MRGTLLSRLAPAVITVLLAACGDSTCYTSDQLSDTLLMEPKALCYTVAETSIDGNATGDLPIAACQKFCIYPGVNACSAAPLQGQEPNTFTVTCHYDSGPYSHGQGEGS